MVALSSSFVEVQENLQDFMIILEYAASELLLNFLLLIEAVFSYLLTKFARHCKLPKPCILCSRLDHILGNENPGFYCNLLCSNHISEISSLFSCFIHGKLADGNSMCEECLLSFSRKSNSNQDMDRLLMGKFGFDLNAYGYQSSVVKGELVSGTMGVRLCSCCNKPWKVKQNADRSHLLKTPRSGMATPNIPLPRRLNHREGLKKMRERFSGSSTPHRLGKISFDHLSHFGYKELKITSDSESDFPFSDDDEGRNIVHRMKEPKEVPPMALTNYFHFDASKDRDRGQQSNQKVYPSSLPELISLDDFPGLSHGKESTDKGEQKFHVSQNSNPFGLSELMSLVDAPSLFKAPLQSSEWKSAGIRNRHEEILKSVTATVGESVVIDQVATETASINPTFVNQTDALKSTTINDNKKIEESVKEPEQLKEDTSENASAQGVGSIPDKRIPVANQARDDEMQTIDPSSSNGAQMIQEMTCMDSGLESIDGSSLSEFDGEGENIVDRLKRQIEHDKRCINTLYKELEEERNASAIAANQAMAMITRLQEEKASLHMEALQYLRMMEEQAEYDVEALEKANDLLAEREKEIQDMEADLEYFRLQLFDETMAQAIPSDQVCDLQVKSTSLDNSSASYAKDAVSVPSASSNQENTIDVKSLWSEFEDEKLFISLCLKDLERKFHHFAHQGSDSDEETVNVGVNKEESQESMNTNHEKANNTLGDEYQIPGSTESIQQVSSGQKSSEQDKEINLINIENEISDLNERLEALEGDWNFLEHTFNSLRSGKEGLQLVQEIAHQLKELRETVTRDRSHFVH